MTFKTSPGANIVRVRVVILDGRMMLPVIMTILAETGSSFDQQGFMAAAMRRVADGAVLCYRRMFPDPGTTLLGMAGITELINTFGLDHVFAQGAMGIMAIRTFDLALNDGMMRHLVGIGADILMTAETHLGLVYCRPGGMAVVAGSTGDIIFLVGAHIPQRQIGRGGMAAQTLIAEFISQTATVFTEGNHSLLGRVAYMLVGSPVTGLAVIFLLPGLSMEGGIKACHRLLMTVNTGCSPCHFGC